MKAVVAQALGFAAFDNADLIGRAAGRQQSRLPAP